MSLKIKSLLFLRKCHRVRVEFWESVIRINIPYFPTSKQSNIFCFIFILNKAMQQISLCVLNLATFISAAIPTWIMNDTENISHKSTWGKITFFHLDINVSWRLFCNIYFLRTSMFYYLHYFKFLYTLHYTKKLCSIT